jgi:predicted metal-dependent hydrolase
MQYWCNNSPVWTHFYNATSALFPAWEGAFCAVAAHHRGNVTSPELLSRIDEFIKQESSHACAHHAMNKRQDLVDLENAEQKKVRVIHRSPDKLIWLATMVSIEHFAACLSRMIINKFHKESTRDFNLFLWHSKEELSHKSLAIDLWNQISAPKEKLRKVAFMNQRYVWKYLLSHTIGSLKNDRVLWKFSTLVDLLCLSSILFFKVFLPSLSIYLPAFHPDNVDDSKYLRAA